MALVHRPRLVITDEAEAGLDPQSRGQVREHLRSLTPGCTILACSHDMAEMERLARRVIILEAGRIAAQGSPEDLKHALGLASVLTLDLSGAPDALGGAFAQAARLVGNVTREGSTLTANGEPGLLAALLEAALGAGARVREARVREPSLEDVFLLVTTRDTGGAAAGDPSSASRGLREQRA